MSKNSKKNAGGSSKEKNQNGQDQNGKSGSGSQKGSQD